MSKTLLNILEYNLEHPMGDHVFTITTKDAHIFISALKAATNAQQTHGEICEHYADKACIRERIRRAELRPTSRYATALDVWEEYLNPASLDDAIETRVNFGAWVAKRLNKEIKCQIALMQ